MLRQKFHKKYIFKAVGETDQKSKGCVVCVVCVV